MDKIPKVAEIGVPLTEKREVAFFRHIAEFIYPEKLRLGSIQKQVSEYQDIIEPLIKLCEVSVKMQNPIRWG